MKKLLLTLSIVAIGACAYAQGISVGAKAGLNLANLNGDDVEDTDMKIGFHIGGYLNVAFSENFSLQPELLFSTAGAKSSYDDPDFGEIKETYKLNYVSVPVMFIYSFGNFNIQAGPQISFLASAKGKIEAGGQSEEVDIKDSLKGTDLSAALGVGASFGKLNASARYCIGLSNIADSDDGDVKNGIIQLSVGFKFVGAGD